MRRGGFDRDIMNSINTVPIVFYHGTDKKLLDYSEKERTEVQKLCTQISNYCYYRFLDDGLSIFSPTNYKIKRGSEIGVDCWSHFLNAFQKYDSRKKDSNLYQYGFLYLTGDRKKAENYARNAYIMGEQGIVAYWLYVAASKVWDLQSSQDLVDLLERFESLIAKPRIPILLTFTNIPKDDLLSERGKEIQWEALGNSITGLSYRLIPRGATCIVNGTVEYL